MEGLGGISIPYLGYVEAKLKIPEVKAFQEDCLFLVMNDHSYGKCVAITIGTLHIDMIIDRAMKEELKQISIAWDCSSISIAINCSGRFRRIKFR